MFNVDLPEFLFVAFLALVVLGPKELPLVMRKVGHWVGKARGVANQFRGSLDDMVRESELAEMEKKWQEENAKIMREHEATMATINGSMSESADMPALPDATDTPAATSDPAAKA
jgi:sec-independent protein translocase protein TatB